MSIVSFFRCLRLLLLTTLAALLVLGGLESGGLNARALASACNTVTEINGKYNCSGECVVTRADGRELISVCGETDTVKYFSPESKDFYQVDIVGKDCFHEVEIGPLVGRILRTATAEVSDNQFPVLEEYVFDTNGECQANGFTKIVRNPSKENFKTCVVYCHKSSP